MTIAAGVLALLGIGAGVSAALTGDATLLSTQRSAQFLRPVQDYVDLGDGIAPNRDDPPIGRDVVLRKVRVEPVKRKRQVEALVWCVRAKWIEMHRQGHQRIALEVG